MNEILSKLNGCFRLIDTSPNVNSIQITKDKFGYDLHIQTNVTCHTIKFGLSELEVAEELDKVLAVDKASSQWQSFDL